MAEPTQFTFAHQEVVEALIKKQDLHEGRWALYVEFGMGAGNVGQDDKTLNPAAILTVARLGLIKAEHGDNNLVVDAAIVNPTLGKVSKKKKT